jgi:hypothetical protein
VRAYNLSQAIVFAQNTVTTSYILALLFVYTPSLFYPVLLLRAYWSLYLTDFRGSCKTAPPLSINAGAQGAVFTDGNHHESDGSQQTSNLSPILHPCP